MPSDARCPGNRAPWAHTVWVYAYAAAVLTIDTLAVHHVNVILPWSMFRWILPGGFDLYKFVFWFAIPLAWSVPRLDAGYFGIARWRRCDLYVLLALAMAGAAAVILTRFVPALHELYPSAGELPAAVRFRFAVYRLLWTLSWLVGWEFMHRYILLRPFEGRGLLPALILVPGLEGLYHVGQKPSAWIEALGMAVFSVLLCWWTLRRRNALLPFLAHGLVEIELLLFQLFV